MFLVFFYHNSYFIHLKKKKRKYNFYRTKIMLSFINE